MPIKGLTTTRYDLDPIEFGSYEECFDAFDYAMSRGSESDWHFVHATREGVKMLIAEMTDDHLMNMIRLIQKAVQKTKTKSTAIENDEFLSGFYGVKKQNAYDSGKQARDIIIKTEKYFVEAALRGLDIMDILASIFGRNSGLGQDDQQDQQKEITF